MEKLEKILSKYQIILLCLLTIPAGLALLAPGFYGASDDMHIAWLYEMDRVLKMGQIPPRFVPDLVFGFGYPLFNFVFPLPFYIGEFFHLLGLGFVDSIKTVFFLSLPLSAFSMYRLLRFLTTPMLAVLGALIYLYTPYRATDIYIRGAIGESLAFIFFPLIILVVIRLTGNELKGSAFTWVGLGGLGLTALILSHNIAAYMVIPFALLLALLRLLFLAQRSLQKMINLGLMVVLGLLGSVYFWLPALIESTLVKYDTVFNFIDHFPTLRQLVTPYWGYGASVPGPYDGISFFLGLPNLVILGVGIALICLFWKKYTLDQKTILGWSLFSVLIAVFLMNHRSAFFWNHLPLLPYFQFPWRFLMVLTLIIPLLVITLAQIKVKDLMILLVAVTVVVGSYQYFHPQDFLGRTDQYYLNRYIPYPRASSEYQQTQEEYLRLPLNTIQRPDKNYPLIEVPGDQIQQIVRFNDLNHLIKVNSKESFFLTYNRFYFPGWQGKLDGQKVEFVPGTPFGQITLPVSTGAHEIEIKFAETPFKRVVDIMSLVGFILSLFLAIKFKYNK